MTLERLDEDELTEDRDERLDEDELTLDRLDVLGGINDFPCPDYTYFGLLQPLFYDGVSSVLKNKFDENGAKTDNAPVFERASSEAFILSPSGP